MTNTLPLFMPIVDKYFDLEQQKINQKQKAHEQNPIQKKVFKQPFRPVPNLDDKTFEMYLNYLMKLPDEKLEIELVYLKNNNPIILDYLNRNFFNDENPQETI